MLVDREHGFTACGVRYHDQPHTPAGATSGRRLVAITTMITGTLLIIAGMLIGYGIGQ